MFFLSFLIFPGPCLFTSACSLPANYSNRASEELPPPASIDFANHGEKTPEEELEKKLTKGTQVISMAMENSMPPEGETPEKPGAPKSSWKNFQERSPTWSYRGDRGPTRWGALSPEWATCSNGRQQSPIDLQWKKPRTIQPLQFTYSPSLWSLFASETSLQVNFPKENHLFIRADQYELSHIQFRSPSEHSLSGRHFPLEMQVVHKSSEGKVAILSVFFKIGRASPPLTKIFVHWPRQKGIQAPVLDSLLNPIELLPQKLSHYEYRGSLTTPPCTEGIRWIVLNTPLEVSREQMASYRGHYPFPTRRPLQKNNQRPVTNFP